MGKKIELVLALLLASTVAYYTLQYSQGINKRKELSDSNFVENTGIGTGKNLTQPYFILFYDPKCKFCKPMLETFEKLVDALPEVGIYSIDCTENRKICAKINIISYPSMILYTVDGQYKEYKRNRSLEKIIEFVRGGYKSTNLQPVKFTPIEVEYIINNVAYIRAAFINFVITVGGPTNASVLSFFLSAILSFILFSILRSIKNCLFGGETKEPIKVAKDKKKQ